MKCPQYRDIDDDLVLVEIEDLDDVDLMGHTSELVKSGLLTSPLCS